MPNEFIGTGAQVGTLVVLIVLFLRALLHRQTFDVEQQSAWKAIVAAERSTADDLREMLDTANREISQLRAEVAALRAEVARLRGGD